MRPDELNTCSVCLQVHVTVNDDDQKCLCGSGDGCPNTSCDNVIRPAACVDPHAIFLARCTSVKHLADDSGTIMKFALMCSAVSSGRQVSVFLLLLCCPSCLHVAAAQYLLSHPHHICCPILTCTVLAGVCSSLPANCLQTPKSYVHVAGGNLVCGTPACTAW